MMLIDIFLKKKDNLLWKKMWNNRGAEIPWAGCPPPDTYSKKEVPWGTKAK